jgi:hypothetical protein
MTDRSRRALLCGATAALALAAGCIADDGADASGSRDDETGDDDAENEENESLAERTFQHSIPTAEPTAALLLDAYDAEAWLNGRPIDDEAIIEFVEETSFETASVTAVEASAPNLCFEPVLDGAAVEDDTLEAEFRVSDDAGADEACAQQATTVGTLIRGSVDGEPIDEASVTVVDREERTQTLDLDAADTGDLEGEGGDDVDDTDGMPGAGDE